MIKNITNNPFRVLGVFSNATIKEITANKGKITAFSKVGKVVEFPSDMVPVLPLIERTVQGTDDALSAINLPLDKLKYSLFWFVNASSIDDIALKHLQAGNIEKALEIFNKKETFSSLLNTAICSFISNDNETAIDCISTLIHDEEYRNEFFKTICGATFSISEDELSRLFIGELLTAYDATELVNFFYGDDLNYVRMLAIQKPIAIINSEITKAKKCGTSAVEMYEAGLLLIQNTQSSLSILQSNRSLSNLKHQVTIKDALARQILQCGINYFNTTDEDEAVEKALVLMEYAISIAVGKLLKDRCQENIDTVSNQAESYIIRNESTALMCIIDKFKEGDLSSITEDFIKECEPYLVLIKGKVGKENIVYRNILNNIALKALNNTILKLNLILTKKDGRIWVINDALTEAWQDMINIGALIMESEDIKGMLRWKNFVTTRDKIRELIIGYKIGNDVARATNCEPSEFWFNKGGSFIPRINGKPTIDLRTEKEFFASCVTCCDFERYIEKYKDGKYRNEAEVKYRDLKLELDRKKQRNVLYCIIAVLIFAIVAVIINA